MQKNRPRKRTEWISPPTSFGELITSDHKILNLENESRNDHRNALRAATPRNPAAARANSVLTPEDVSDDLNIFRWTPKRMSQVPTENGQSIFDYETCTRQNKLVTPCGDFAKSKQNEGRTIDQTKRTKLDGWTSSISTSVRIRNCLPFGRVDTGHREPEHECVGHCLPRHEAFFAGRKSSSARGRTKQSNNFLPLPPLASRHTLNKPWRISRAQNTYQQTHKHGS